MTPRAGTRAIGLFLAAAVGCGSDADSGVERSVDAKSRPIRAAVHSNASVAAKLAEGLRDQSGNLFYSPLSIEAVTGMLFAGAAGETATQLATFLDAEDDPAALHEGLGTLLRDLRREHPQYTLSVANRLWARPGLESSAAFVETVRDDYDAPIEPVDFVADPEAARAKINDWVSDQTDSKIPTLLQPGQIRKTTVVAIVNAIYFKADWAKAFDPEHTQSDTFFRADGSEVSVQMMDMAKSKVRARIDAEALWLELPYRTGDVSFLAYTRHNAGDEIASVQALQRDLEDVDLNEVVASLGEGEYVVQMPRFSLRSRIDLIPVFQALGVTDLFDDARADLSNIRAGGGVFVNPFVHEAAIWVDEQGTVAAAATAAVGQFRSGPPTIRLDHPFVFMIRDNLTGAILFTGHVADPSVSAD